MHIKKILTFLASAIITWLPVGAEDIRFIGDDNLIYRIDTETCTRKYWESKPESSSPARSAYPKK